MMNNPYLEEATPLLSRWCDRHERNRLVAKYAWAIPNEAAVDAIAALSPIVEIGAGNGYWAWLLRQKGATVKAYDKKPGHHATSAKDQALWTGVVPGSARAARRFQDHALFLCWPPYHSSFASRCLSQYHGDTVAYVGESQYGCTGDNAFFDELYDKFSCVTDIDIPRWDGIYDRLTIWRRM